MQLLDEFVVPVVCNDNALVLLLRTLEVPQLQFLDKVFHRCSSWTRFSCPWLWEMTGGESFSPDDAYGSAWYSVKLMKGNYTIDYFQYQDVVEYVCMLNDGSAALTVFAPTTTTTSSLSCMARVAVQAVLLHRCRSVD